MDTTRRALLGTAAASIALSGCLGDGAGSTPTDEDDDTPTESGDDSSPEETTAGADETMTEQDVSPTVQVRSHPDHGDILVGPDELTLYNFDQDEQGAGASTCSGSCAETWPPLTVEEPPDAGDGVAAELTTFERDDGSMQVAANGWPLYYYAPDEEPGDATGQGVGDIWWVLDPDGVPIRPDDGTDTPTPTDGMGY